MDWDNTKKIKLIQLVRERQMLWDPKHPLYSKKNSKEVSWTEIAAAIGTTSN